MTQASDTSTDDSSAQSRTPSADEASPSSGSGRAAGLVRRYWAAFAVLVILIVVVSAAVPGFFTQQNLLLVGEQSAVTGVTAVGMTFVVITAGIDLSVGATLGLVSVITALMLQHHHHAPEPLIFVAGLLVGIGAGLVNAFGVAWLRMQPFVLTLATSAVVGGLALNLSGGTQLQLPLISGGILGFLGDGSIFGLPAALVVFLICALVGGFVLRYTPYGRYTYAVGGSMEAARLSGIPVRRILLGAYAIAGLCAALAGILATARVNVGDPNAGSLTTLNAIAAVVIGGTSLFGGSGGMTGSVFGAILLSALADALNVKGVSAFDQEIWQGVVIIIAILWTTARSQGAAKLHSLRQRIGSPTAVRKGNTSDETA